MRDSGDTNQLDGRLREAASRLAYPQTPDIAGRAGQRLAAGERRPDPRLRRVALAAALLLLAALLAVPEARAAAIRLLQIGVVRIRVEPAPTAISPTATVAPPAPVAPTDLGLAGETTLADAARLVDFAIRLPAYPADLGPPDQVFLQDLAGEALVLVWRDPADPSQTRMSLEILTSRMFVEKVLYGDETQILSETQVGDAPALWVRGRHFLMVRRDGREEIELRRLVAGDVLIWTAGGLTYRLESRLDLEEARRVAESLR
jgi:hypothetical protein